MSNRDGKRPKQGLHPNTKKGLRASATHKRLFGRQPFLRKPKGKHIREELEGS